MNLLFRSLKIRSNNLKQFDSLLQIIPLPQWQGIEVTPVHVERHLEVLIVEMLLQIASVQIRRQFVVGCEEDVERVRLVFTGEGGRRRPRGEVSSGKMTRLKSYILSPTVQCNIHCTCILL